MFRVFSHLQRHPSSGIFYFRIAIPVHLRDTIGKCEMKRSLGTGLRAEATVKAQRLYADAMELFTRLEKRTLCPLFLYQVTFNEPEAHILDLVVSKAGSKRF